MNQSDIEHILARLGVDKPHVVLRALLDAIQTSLAAGEPVKFTNFGKFEVKNRVATKRRVPGTDNVVDVPEQNTVVFLPAPALKKRMNP